MTELILKCKTGDAVQEVPLSEGRTRIGRGSDAELRLDDDGLSRLNSTIFREDDRFWIVDDGSTNGTFVNDVPAASAGTILNVGDVIRIGSATTIEIDSAQAEGEKSDTAPATPEPNAAAVATQPSPKASSVPVLVIAGGIFVIVISVAIGLIAALGTASSNNTGNFVSSNDTDFIEPDRTPRPSNQSKNPTPTPESNGNTETPLNTNDKPIEPLAPGKKYLEMSETERRAYVATRAMQVAQVIGNSSSDQIPAAALERIVRDVNSFTTRTKAARLSGCRFGDNLQATFERASKNAPFIVRAFNERSVDPRIGLYLAMIESEHCVCLQSPTGPLGLFQFTYATAKIHFEPSDGVIRGATISNPDIRCQPEPAARASASYMKALLGRYGTGPASVPLAIGSYNSGEGGLSSNLKTALESNSGLPRDFWTLIANSEKLSKQFQAENFKYVPKFFAAAIIGENPRDFGLELNPLSTYSK